MCLECCATEKNEREDQVEVYRTVVKRAFAYGAETCASKKAQEKKLEVTEIRVLRCMCGNRKQDTI